MSEHRNRIVNEKVLCCLVCPFSHTIHLDNGTRDVVYYCRKGQFAIEKSEFNQNANNWPERCPLPESIEVEL